jgi:hypothetical protein
MFWKLTLFFLVPHTYAFPFITHRGRNLLATFSGNNAVRPTGNHFPPHNPPCVRGREGPVRASARKGVQWPCMYACVNACATLPLLLDTCRSSFRPHHNSLSCPQHAPLLPSSTTPAASPGSPLVLEMHRSSPGHQHESLVASSKTRLSCRAPLLLRSPLRRSTPSASDSRDFGNVR